MNKENKNKNTGPQLPKGKLPDGKNPNKPDKDKKGGFFSIYWLYLVLAVVFILINFLPRDFSEETAWIDVRDMIMDGDVEKFLVINRENVEVFIREDALHKNRYSDFHDKPFYANSKGPHFSFYIGDVQHFEENVAKTVEEAKLNYEIPIRYDKRANWGGEVLNWIIFIVIMVAIWIFIMRRMSGGGGPGGQIFNIGKSRATLFDKDTKVSVSFKDVAGLEEAKEEVMEVVDFLKNPDKYSTLGGKIPKGILLVGPPGTGKTLLAKAVAGQANVPFFSLSGSDFVEMFVGVGASRVRDLFKQAKEKAPCIIFIDEIDAIGRARGKQNMHSSNDERENTLNQLLTEMDGFSTNSGVILLAATNRPDILDSALLRPGRFDRQISIDKPDLIGREAIFKVHLKGLKFSKEIDANKLAAQTPGFAGAEIANVCNEAALIAARKGKKQIEMDDFHDAIDRVIGGLEKKNKIISPEEKKIVAFHEAGHAIAGWYLEHAAPLLKVSIVPRGVAALGYAQYLPKEQYLYTKEQLLDTICMTLGGRVAEDIMFNKISTGAQNDLERITKMAHQMITIYGMNEKVGNVSYHDPANEYGFHRPYSEKTAELIDNEIRTFIKFAYQRTKDLLQTKSKQLKKVAEQLLSKEILFKSDLETILGNRPFDQKQYFDTEVVDKTDEKDNIDKKDAEKNTKKSGTAKNVKKVNSKKEKADKNITSEISGNGSNASTKIKENKADSDNKANKNSTGNTQNEIKDKIEEK